MCLCVWERGNRSEGRKEKTLEGEFFLLRYFYLALLSLILKLPILHAWGGIEHKSCAWLWAVLSSHVLTASFRRGWMGLESWWPRDKELPLESDARCAVLTTPASLLGNVVEMLVRRPPISGPLNKSWVHPSNLFNKVSSWFLGLLKIKYNGLGWQESGSLAL